ncbi:hypothetical protein Cgig2_016317 [Carnegiea gigantea]|uniref:Hexosyltransferase n=1 Tax=Carnegiea gigantea TaxID=171969 RepID=A0A9Q1KHB7_9CARY|nr:hypothetical protein Cgig2_016317 [Carnegiea gigantea]
MPRGSAVDHHYSKSEKTRKSFLHSSHSHPYRHLVFFSIICLLVGISGTIFSLISLSRSRSPPVFRCGRVQDTFRGHYLFSNHVQRSRKIGGVGNSLDRPKFLGFVGVQTGFESADRRQALRSTWFPSDPEGLLRLEQATGLAFRFVIGRSKDAKMMAELSEEMDKYKDFMVIDIEEEYAKLPYKTYESQGHLIGNEYFLHAYGPMYILSAEVVAALATARNNSLRMFSNEDVTIGSWMLAMNVHHEDNRAICDPKCTPTSIAVWDIPKCSGLCNPATRLKELHQISMCSKSPTLPPEDEE